MEEEEKLLEKLVPKKILGLLLKKDMSTTELAEAIYANKNARGDISCYVHKFEEKGWVRLIKKYGRKETYRSTLRFLGDNLNESESKFIYLIIERFWIPLNDDLIDSLIELLLNTLIIKRVYNATGRILYYLPKKDLRFYENNKEQFWSDSIFRSKFLNKIRFNGEIKTHVRESFHRTHDFLFVSLLAPESLIDRILEERSSNPRDPLFVLFNLLHK